MELIFSIQIFDINMLQLSKPAIKHEKKFFLTRTQFSSQNFIINVVKYYLVCLVVLYFSFPPVGF